MDIQLDKKLLWIQPYIKVIIRYLPKNKLEQIKGYTVIDKNYKQEGQTLKNPLNGKCTITLKLNRLNIEDNDYYYNILHTLAHELAHLTHFNHSANQFELTGFYMQKFAKVLKKQKIKDTYKRIP